MSKFRDYLKESVSTQGIQKAIKQELNSWGGPSGKNYIGEALVPFINELLFEECRQFAKNNKKLMQKTAEEYVNGDEEISDMLDFFMDKWAYKVVGNEIKVIETEEH